MNLFKDKVKFSLKNEIMAFLPALLLVILFRSIMYEPYKIPSISMKPNLIEGDYIFVSKYIYGISHHSFPFSPKLFSGRILKMNHPARGDVIVFRLPSEPGTKYIKRLIGLPGDKVQLINGIVYINGEAIERELVGRYKDNSGQYYNKFREILPSGKSYYIIKDLYESWVDNTEVYEVPEDHYFFLGDNRNHSQDSRFLKKVGYVPVENLMGKAQMIICSSNAPFIKIWKWINEFDYSRVLKKIALVDYEI